MPVEKNFPFPVKMIEWTSGSACNCSRMVMTRFWSSGEKLLPFRGRFRQIVAAREFESKLSSTSSDIRARELCSAERVGVRKTREDEKPPRTFC